MNISDDESIYDSEDEVGNNANVGNPNNHVIIQDNPDNRMSDSDEESINDSEDEIGNNVMGIIDGPNNLVVIQNNPGGMIDGLSEESVYDSEDDVGNNALEVDLDDRNNLENIPQELIADAEDESIINSDASINDSEDENDVGEELIHVNNQTFVLNIEGNGLDVRLRTGERGNVEAWEQFILVLAKTLRFKESYVSMLATFKIMNQGFENPVLPENMPDFWRVVNRRNENFVNLVVCTVCWVIIGEGKRPTRNCLCSQCGPGRTNSELGTYLYLNVRSLMEGLLSKPGIAKDLRYRHDREKRNDDAIEDVYDGSEYRRHAAEGGFLHENNHNYSLAMWVDGVSPSKTSNVQVVPVFFQVLEFSPRARQRNSMLVAVYVGPRKVLMSQYLTPITIQLQDLRLEGVHWRHENEERISKFMLLIISADAEERYTILGMTRHNGHFGCTFCDVDAVPNVDGNGRLHYPVENEENVEDRTNQNIRDNARVADETGLPERGVKAISALDPLDVDLRTAQLVEPLHLFWKGNFPRLYSNFTHPQRPGHIVPGQVATISERVTSIRTPTKLSRLPRSLTHFSKFTATESRNTSWHYWLPCAQDILNEDQLRLSSLFAESTFIMNKDSILPNELDNAEQLLTDYRQLFQDSFPGEEWVYNVHTLRHAVRCVRELGPSWVASGFWFESLNRQVVNYLTSPTDRASQVACRMLLGQMIEKCLDMEMTPTTLRLLREFIGKETWEVRPDIAVGAYILLDEAGTEVLFVEEQINALTVAGFHNVDREIPIIVYNKVCIDGITYQVVNERPTKYNNSIAHVNTQHYADGIAVEFIEIVSIVTWQHDGDVEKGMFGTPFRTIEPAFETTYMRIVEKLNENIVYVALTDVVIPGVLVQTAERTYISRLSNRWDND